MNAAERWQDTKRDGLDPAIRGTVYTLRSAAHESRVKCFVLLSSIVTMGTMLRDDRPVSRHEWFETSEQIALSVDHKGYVYGAPK